MAKHYRVLIAEARESLREAYIACLDRHSSTLTLPKIDYLHTDNLVDANQKSRGDEVLTIVGHLHRNQKHTQEPTARTGLDFIKGIGGIRGGYTGIVLAVDDNEVLQEARALGHGGFRGIYCTGPIVYEAAGERTLARLLSDLPGYLDQKLIVATPSTSRKSA